MASREVAMWEILVLRRVQGGDTNSAVARTTGRSRSTVRRYLAAAAELGWTPGAGEPTEALVARSLAEVLSREVMRVLQLDQEQGDLRPDGMLEHKRTPG